HLIRTPGGWRAAGELKAGDRVVTSEEQLLSDQQWQVVLGSLLGDGNLSPNRQGRNGVRFRLGHGAAQTDYLDWKVSLLGNVGCSRRGNDKGAVFADFRPLPELGELQRTVYMGDGNRTITEEYLKALTPLALAIWFMDDGSFTVRSSGLQQRTKGGSGRVQFCIEALSEGSRDRLVDYLRDTHGLDVQWRNVGAAGKAVLTFTTTASARFLEMVAPYVHPSMDYKLLPRLRGRFEVEPEMVEPRQRPVPARVLDIHVKPPARSMHRFDIEVEGQHNYFVDGVMVHNSPETTTGGKALKFYASVRLDVRRIESLKDGTDFVGNRTKCKVVKNKCAAPFKQAEFDIMYGQGISREGGLIDVGVDSGLVRKAGAWYTYEGDQLGQGKENARSFLRDNPDLANELEKRILEKLGVGATVEDEAPAEPTDVDF
ncbi:MAG: intein-containing recombinase RecA, partial [Nocardioidaceae bacterium]